MRESMVRDLMTRRANLREFGGERAAFFPMVKKVARASKRASSSSMRGVWIASGPSSIVSQTSRRGVSKCVTTGPHHEQFATSVG